MAEDQTRDEDMVTRAAGKLSGFLGRPNDRRDKGKLQVVFGLDSGLTGLLERLLFNPHPHPHPNPNPTIERKLDQVLAALNDIKKDTQQMSAELDALTAKVSDMHGAVVSAVAAIAGLRQQIIDAGTDPAKLQALTDSLGADGQALAEAIANNPAPPSASTRTRP